MSGTEFQRGNNKQKMIYFIINKRQKGWDSPHQLTTKVFNKSMPLMIVVAQKLLVNMSVNELDNFIGKWMKLKQTGKEANLVLNTLAGNAWAYSIAQSTWFPQ